LGRARRRSFDLDLLAESGFNLNYADYDRRSAAHVAAANGKKKALRYLRKNGCEIGEKDRWGDLPVDDAERNGHEDIAKLLRRWMRSSGNASDGFQTPSVSESVISHRQQVSGHANKSDRSSAPVAAKMGSQSIQLLSVSEDDECDDDNDSDDSHGCTAPSTGKTSRNPSRTSCNST